MDILKYYSIPTVSLALNRALSERVVAPRAAVVRFPHGAPFGEPGEAS